MEDEKQRDRLRKIVTGSVLDKGKSMTRYETDRFIDNVDKSQHEKWLKEHVDKGNV